MGTDAILRLSNLTVCYGAFTAVDRLSLELRPGELFGLLGPNGAGKSSTLRVLIGQGRPSGGRVTVAGLDLVRTWQRIKPQFGYVPDRENHFEEFSGRRNLQIFAGLGAGGAIFNYLSNYNSSVYGNLGVSDVTVDNNTLALNQAVGGVGGNGEGGGVADLLNASTTITDSTILLNLALGGLGGDGLGGGFYNDATSTLTLQDSIVIFNLAAGGPGGQGIGGGIYNLGTLSMLATILKYNHATTSNDNIGP
jgi:hypothetical protein